MSLGARATSKGGAKGTGGKESKHNIQDKGKSAEKPQPKDKAKPQATTEQLRMANMIDRKTEEALDVRRMVLELMEMTCRTEEEVCSALHDSDNDMALACDLLLEENQRIQGEWQTNEKKKKKSTAVSTGNGDADPPASINPRSRSGPRQRRDGGSGEGGQRGRGSGRGRGSARGGRAGGRGPGRPRPGGPRPRPNTHHDPWPDSVDDNAYGSSSAFPATEDWEADDKYVAPNASSFPAAEDWDNEEWSGSLADSKMSQVFTPSVQPQPASEPESLAALNNSLTENWEASLSDSPSNNGPTSDAHLNYTYHNSSHHVSKSAEGVGRKLESVTTPVSSVDLTHAVNQSQQQPIGLSGSLSAAQSQYLSQLTQQSQQQLDNSVYTSNYGVYGATELTSQRKPQRVRVPPPSKIPSSAVEMPGGEPSQMGFIDVQFGALEPDALSDPVPAMHQTTPKQVSQAESSPPTHTSHDAVAEANYTSAANMLSESLSVAESTPSGATVTADAAPSSSLESRLTASMKQLTTSEAGPGTEAVAATPATQPYAAPYHHQQYTQRAKHQTVGQQSMYATHHAVSHHPVYGANVYTPQVNSTNASLTGASAMTSAYPPSVTLSQYHTQPLNSYQQTSSSASVYGGSALYTAAAPYTAYQPTPSKLTSAKDVTYESSVSSQRPLSGSSTTQAAAAKVTTATAKVTSGTNASAAQYAVQAQPQPQAFYTQQQGQAGAAAAYAAYAAEEAQMLRGTLPHHMVNNGGYYELGYGVSGVTGAREPATSFGLGAGERFGRADASSPQQVAPTLPPGYAFYYQAAPPPATYQTYGVFPYGGGGSSVTGVGGVSGAAGAKVASYSQQQPQYDTTQQQQDTYKQGGYSGGAKTGGAGGAGTEITSAMYAKAHATLNKVNSYEKAAFHSGTPPPFGGSAPHHLYIPAAPPAHHNPHHHHQQQHQESSGGSTRGAGAGKPAGSKPYSQSYWAPN